MTSPAATSSPLPSPSDSPAFQPSHQKPLCVMILAGEASGDLHGGGLSSALFKKDPSLRIIGIGGPAMKKAGVEIIYDMAHLGIVGLSEIFPKARSIWKGYQAAKAALMAEADILVLIDFPDFNLMMAKAAKRMGIPVVYYIAPQVWAWRKGRLATIAQRVDKVLVIFPFEEEIYQQANIPCEFVGHPLLDRATPFLEKPFSRSDYLRKKGIDPSSRVIGLLPGSRESEIKRHLPLMLEGIRQLAQGSDRTPVTVLIPVAPGISMERMREVTQSSSLPIHLIAWEEEGDGGEALYSLLRAADAVVVASGTATLEAALAIAPMVIIYTVSWITYALVRPWLYIRSIGLVNIVAKTDLVPELIQNEATPDRICEEVTRILENGAIASQIRTGLSGVAKSLGTPGAATRAAEAVYEVLLKKHSTP